MKSEAGSFKCPNSLRGYHFDLHYAIIGWTFGEKEECMASKREISFTALVAIALGVATIACSLTGSPSSPTTSSTQLPLASSTSPPPTSTPLSLTQLRMNLQVGEIYKIRMISSQQLTQTLDGETQVTDQSLGYGYSYTVTEVDGEGNISVDALYDWALFEQEGPLGSVSYDSDNPPEVIPDAALGFHALVGNGFSIKFSPEGLVLDISGLDEMYAGMIDEMGIDDAAIRAQMEQLLQEQFSADTLSDQLNNLTLQLPEEALQVGDSWTVSADSSAMVPMQVETTYTLVAIDGDIASIDVSSIITPDPDGGILDLGVIQIGYSLNGTQEGFLEVDVNTGMTLNFTLNQSMEGEMVMYLEGEEIIVPTSIEAITTIESVAE